MTKAKQGRLLPTPEDQFRQQDITGTGTLKQTAPKSVRDAIETFLLKKEEHEATKSNLEKAKNRVVAEMEATETGRVQVKDEHGQLYIFEISSKKNLEVKKLK